MKLKKIEEIIINHKFKQDDAKIIIYQRYSDFVVFRVEESLNKSLSGKFTKDKIEFYGLGYDKFFNADEQGFKDFFRVVQEDLDSNIIPTYH